MLIKEPLRNIETPMLFKPGGALGQQIEVAGALH